MTPVMLTKDRYRQRQPGLYHGLSGHVANAFEQALGNYRWSVPQGQSAGKLFRVAPSGPGATVFTLIPLGPFQ